MDYVFEALLHVFCMYPCQTMKKARSGRTIVIMNSRQFLDSGGRRSGGDRREFRYDAHIPENRSGLDNRHVSERRVTKDRRIESERRIPGKHAPCQGPERRSPEARRLGTERRASI